MNKIYAFIVCFFLSIGFALVGCAAPFVVNSIADSGPGSLRDAITQSNTSAGPNTIKFNILPSGANTIVLATVLPKITSPVIIDATSQPGWAVGAPVINVSLTGGGNIFDFEAGSGGSTIKGFSMSGGNRAIYMESSNGNTISGNFIGLDPTGMLKGSVYLSWSLVEIFNCNNTKIGGIQAQDRNVIAGSNEAGLRFSGASATGTVILNNFIGTDKTGAGGPGNNNQGILVAGNVNFSNSIIGGSAPDSLNVISNNNQIGILFGGGNNVSSNVTISGNYIGVNANGNAALGNKSTGMEINNGTGFFFKNNIVSGNTNEGIVLNNAPSATITGNIVGMLPDGKTVAANGGAGIKVIKSTNTTIGGLTADKRNVFSGNVGSGVRIEAGSDNTIVEGNYIGVDITGLTPAGNMSNGINNESNNVTVGGTTYGARNIVSGNKGEGIAYAVTTGGTIKGNFVGLDKNGSGNYFFGNTGAGILIRDAVGTIIGGASGPEHNVSSQNGFTNWMHGGPVAAGSDGIRVLGGSNLIIKGNWTGTDSTGLIKMGNSWGGISLNENFGSTIGGTAPGEFNIASGNLNEGIYIRNVLNSAAQNINVIGNYVGVGSDGKTAIGNEDYGINITTGSNVSNNISQNIIANTGKAPSAPSSPSSGNGGSGIIVGGTSQYNLFTKNTIYCNLIATLLTGAGNESVKAPTLDYTDNVIAKGTAAPGNTVEIFGNPSAGSCGCQGETYVGTTVADANGNWTFTHNLGAKSANLSASQTTALKSTSQFSPCCTPPKITTLPVTQTICVGGNATFTGDGTGSIYKWIVRKPGTKVFTALADGGVYSGTTTKSLQITAATKDMDSSEYRIVVYGCYPMDTSIVNVSFLYLKKTTVKFNQTICPGASATLTASGASSYTWSPITGLSSASGATVVASPASTTTYIVTGTSPGCSDTAQVTVTIATSLAVQVTGPFTICQNNSQVLTASGATTYTWSPATGLSSTTGAIVTASPTSTTTYTVTGNTGACQGAASSKVTVIPFVKIKVSPPVSICNGQSTSLSVLNPDANTTYVWTENTLNGTSDGSTSTITVTPAVTTVYIVTGNQGGCTDSAKTTVTVGATLALSVSTNPADGTICEGQTATITASGASTYSWSPAATLDNASSATVKATPAITTDYTVVAGSPGCTQSKKITITVNKVPVITRPPNPAICSKGNFSIPINAPNTPGAVYSWLASGGSATLTGASNGNGAFIDNTNQPLTNLGSGDGVITYTLTAKNGTCQDTLLAYVTVYPLPDVQASGAAPQCSGNATSIALKSGQSAATFDWVASSASTTTSGQSNGSGATIAQTLVNTGITSDKVTYSITATVPHTSGACKSLPVLTDVVVHPVPVFNPLNPYSICSFSDSSIALNPLISGTSFTWTVLPSSNVVGAGGGGGGAGIIPLQLSTNDPADGTVTYTVKALLNNCPFNKDVLVNVHPKPTIKLTYRGALNFCKGNSVTLISNPPNVYTWSNGVLGDSIIVSTANAYSSAITDKNGCKGVSDVLSVSVFDFPKAIAGLDSSPVCVGKPVQLGVADKGQGYTYEWHSKPAYFTSSEAAPLLPLGQSTTFFVTVNNKGCKDSSAINIKTIDESNTIYVPNSFSPNGDGINDSFQPKAYGLPKFEVAIYNRWGEMIYTWKGLDGAWDGLLKNGAVQQDVYVYTIKASGVCTSGTIQKTGIVTLIK